MSSIDESYAKLGLKPGCSLTEAKEKYRQICLQNHPDKHLLGHVNLDFDASKLKEALRIVQSDIDARVERVQYWSKVNSTEVQQEPHKTGVDVEPATPRKSKLPNLRHSSNLRAFVYILWKAGKTEALTSKQILESLKREDLLILYEGDQAPKAQHNQCVMKKAPIRGLVGRVGSRFDKYSKYIVGEKRDRRSGSFWRLSDEYWDIVNQYMF